MPDYFEPNESGTNPVDADTGSRDIYFSNEDYAKIIRDYKKTNGNFPQATLKNKKKKGTTVLSTYMFFIIVFCVSAVISVYAILCLNDLFGMTKSKDSVTVSYNQELKSPYDAIDILAENKLITCKNFCKLLVKLETTLLSRQTSLDGPFEPGSYSLNGKMGFENMLITMLGKADTAETVRLTFPEGYTMADITKRLVDNEVISDKNAFISVVQNTQFSYSLVSSLTYSETVPFRLEGYLFPDTYDFYIGQSPASVIETFLKNTENKITEEYRKRAEELGFTMHEIIIIASIIQAEAANNDQMPVIAGIIENRLKDPTNWPSLGCQSTSDYITSKLSSAIGTTGHSADYYLSYYNTQISSNVEGLPEGPICNPGIAAIKAALYPKDTDCYFFFHDINRNIYTAKTNSEFRSLIQKYAPYLL